MHESTVDIGGHAESQRRTLTSQRVALPMAIEDPQASPDSFRKVTSSSTYNKSEACSVLHRLPSALLSARLCSCAGWKTVRNELAVFRGKLMERFMQGAP